MHAMSERDQARNGATRASEVEGQRQSQPYNGDSIKSDCGMTLHRPIDDDAWCMTPTDLEHVLPVGTGHH